MPARRYWHVRIDDPSRYSVIRTIHVGSRGVQLLVGRPRGGRTTRLVSARFPKDRFATREAVQRWLRRYGLPADARRIQ